MRNQRNSRTIRPVYAEVGVDELGHDDAENPVFADLDQFAAGEDVMEVVGRVNAVIDLLSITLAAWEERRPREEVDVVAYSRTLV